MPGQPFFSIKSVVSGASLVPSEQKQLLTHSSPSHLAVSAPYPGPLSSGSMLLLLWGQTSWSQEQSSFALCLAMEAPPPRGSGLTHLTIQDPLSIEGLPEPGSVVLRRGFGRGSSPRGFWRSAHPSRRAQNPAQGWSPLQTITQARRNEHPLLLQAKTGQPQRGFCNRLPAPLSKAEVREAAFTAKWERRGSRAG